jgi:hypothetical protein
MEYEKVIGGCPSVGKTFNFNYSLPLKAELEEIDSILKDIFGK